MKITLSTGPFKIALAWVAVFLFRLIPWRPPNVEPMLAVVMPLSKRSGVAVSFLFGLLGIALYDAVTSGWGVWTLVTALAYGALGIAAHFYFKRREASVGNFLSFGILGTLLYDAVTMMIGPIFNGQSFAVALLGQIPFTLLHLLGTIAFAVILSPALFRWMAKSETITITLPQRARAFVK